MLNMDKLVEMVNNYFCQIEDCERVNAMTREEMGYSKDSVLYIPCVPSSMAYTLGEKTARVGEALNAVSAVCIILGIDMADLFCLVKSINRHERKTNYTWCFMGFNWCFPWDCLQSQQEKIYDYLKQV